MDQFSRLVLLVSHRFGILPGQVFLVLGFLLLLLFLCFRRNFWGTLKIVLVVGALSLLGYFAFDLTQAGIAKRELLLNKPIGTEEP